LSTVFYLGASGQYQGGDISSQLELHSIALMYYTELYKKNVKRAGEPKWIFCIGMRIINLKQYEATAEANPASHLLELIELRSHYQMNQAGYEQLR
jgi:hypothetical protein